VNSLSQQDSRFAGIQAYEWNDTVTTQEKRVDRARKIADAKQKVINEKKRKADAEEREKRREEWL
jgi:hypothetical protein